MLVWTRLREAPLLTIAVSNGQVPTPGALLKGELRRSSADRAGLLSSMSCTQATLNFSLNRADESARF